MYSQDWHPCQLRQQFAKCIVWSAGIRPNSAPASSDMQHSQDSSRQTVKRRQVTASYEPPSALPGFRPGPCLTADSQISRSRHSLRPGTPITKAEAAAAATSLATSMRATSSKDVRDAATSLASSMKATSSRDVREAAIAASKTVSSSQDLPITRWLNSRSPAGSTGSVIASATASLQTASQADNDMARGQEASMLSHSDPGKSSSAASVQHSTQRLVKKVLAPQATQSAVKGLRSPVRRSLSQGCIPSANSEGSDSFSSLRTSSTMSPSPRKSLDVIRQKSNADSVSGGQNKTAHHMSGNSVMSYISKTSVAAEPADVTVDTGRSVPPCSTAADLLKESNEIMQWFGMDDLWFEAEFLPFAEQMLTSDTPAQ